MKSGGRDNETTDNPEKEKEEEDEWQTDDEADEMEWQDDGDDGDDNDSDGWVDVVHSEDEAEDAVPGEESDLATEKKKAESISSTRILTEDDFKKIQQRSLVQEVDGGASRKRARTTATEHTSQGNSEIVSLPQIENVCKKKKHDKESRLATVREGRGDKDQFKQKMKQKRQNEHASTTNAEKQKRKPFMMVSHSGKARGKAKRSFRDKQIALRDALVKREKAGKKR